MTSLEKQANALLTAGKPIEALSLVFHHVRENPDAAGLLIAPMLKTLQWKEFSLSAPLIPQIEAMRVAPNAETLMRLAAALVRCLQIATNNGVILGAAEPQIDFALSLEDGKVHFNVYGRESKHEGLDRSQMQALAEDLQQILDGGDAKQLNNLASRLAQAGDYTRSNAALERWLAVSGAPDPNALNLLGSNHYFLEDFEQAISYYLLALSAGAPKEIIEYNVWESCGELIQRHPEQRAQWRALYREHFPDGARTL